MHIESHSTERARIVAALCGSNLCFILLAGLWPFHAPKNEAKWLENTNGMYFGHYASILSVSTFHPSPSSDSSSGSIEILLETHLPNQRATIIAFDSLEHPGGPFSLAQHKAALVIQRHNVDNRHICRTAYSEVPNVFQENKRVFITITLGRRDTSVYIDGAPVMVSPLVGTSARN